MNYQLFVGIDISKLTIDVATLVNGIKDDIKHNQFNNDAEGFDKMLKWIQEMYSFGHDEMVFLLEHTGIYALPICTFFSDKNLNYCLESPLQIVKSLGIKRGKTDKADSIALVKYAYIHREDIKLYTLPARILIKLKALLAYRNRMVKARKLLGTPSKELKDYSDKEIHSYVTSHSARQVKELDQQIKNVDREIRSLIRSDKTLKRLYDLVKSVPGIGPQTASYLLIYTKCFTAFENSRKFACYAGLAPFEHQSGISIRGKTRVSYLANRQIKTLLTSGAIAASIHDPEMSAYYQRKIELGKARLSVLNVIRNKMVSRVFAAVKRGTPFMKLYDHREKMVSA